jgi:acylphosphatase
MKVRARLLIKGRVQGVGFRWYVRQVANDLRLAGYVRNLVTGDVEVDVEGKRDTVETLIKRIHTGPSFAKVFDVSVEWGEYSATYDSFAITF